MTIVWLLPVVFWATALIAIPVAVHLLAREQTRLVRFPSIRFLQGVRVPALRRRLLHDWSLLAVRVAIIVAAVSALAGPVVLTKSRQREWQSRVARAIVIAERDNAADDAAAGLLARAESEGIYVAASFRTQHVDEALRQAVFWLNQQTSGTREVLVAGDLRIGQFSAGTLHRIPADIGVRFLPVPNAAVQREIRLSGATTIEPRTPIPIEIVATLDSDKTRATYRVNREQTSRRSQSAGQAALDVRAAAADRQSAIAALLAVRMAGPPLDPATDRRVLVVFERADDQDLHPIQSPPGAFWMRQALEQLHPHRGGQKDDQLIVHAGLPATDERAPAVLARIAEATLAFDFTTHEPERIAAADLARWSRRPIPQTSAPTLVDQGDRRWLWAVALALLALEAVVRRRAANSGVAVLAADLSGKESRVA